MQDGRIAEAVVWETPLGERHLILDSIVSFALRRHLPVGSSVDTFAGCLDAALIESGADPSGTEAAYRCTLPRSPACLQAALLHDSAAAPPRIFTRHPVRKYLHPSMLCRRLDAAATKLSSQLLNCSTSPLKITAVQPLGLFSRHMAAFAPQPSSLAGSSGSSEAGAPRVMEAVQLLLSLEASGAHPRPPHLPPTYCGAL